MLDTPIDPSRSGSLEWEIRSFQFSMASGVGLKLLGSEAFIAFAFVDFKLLL